MAQQMLAEQTWKGGNKSHTEGKKKCANQKNDDKDGGGEKSDEGGEISRSARDLCALRELKNDGSDEKEEDDEEEENIASHSSLLCPAGIWMTEEDAMERHGINAKVMRLYKKECTPVNIHSEF